MVGLSCPLLLLSSNAESIFTHSSVFDTRSSVFDSGVFTLWPSVTHLFGSPPPSGSAVYHPAQPFPRLASRDFSGLFDSCPSQVTLGITFFLCWLIQSRPDLHYGSVALPRMVATPSCVLSLAKAEHPASCALCRFFKQSDAIFRFYRA